MTPREGSPLEADGHLSLFGTILWGSGKSYEGRSPLEPQLCSSPAGSLWPTQFPLASVLPSPAYRAGLSYP